MNEAIFDSAQVALRAAYFAEVNAVYPKSATAIALDALVTTSGKSHRSHSRHIDTRGLKPHEYFAQCALIRNAVEHKNLLTFEEIYAIWARYACNHKKALGYVGIAKHIEKLTSNQGKCLLDIVCSIYLDDPAYSERALAQKHGCSRHSINVDKNKAISADYSLHASALMRVDMRLKSAGLVGELVV